jgi:hypothetical protein
MSWNRIFPEVLKIDNDNLNSEDLRTYIYGYAAKGNPGKGVMVLLWNG